MPIIGKHHVHPYSNAWGLKDGNRLVDSSTARLFQAYFAAKILVSRFVAKTWPAFRSLWRESGMADHPSRSTMKTTALFGCRRDPRDLTRPFPARVHRTSLVVFVAGSRMSDVICRREDHFLTSPVET